MRLGCCQTSFCTSYLELYELLSLFVILYSVTDFVFCFQQEVSKFSPAFVFSFTINSNSHLMAAAVPPHNDSGWIYERTLGSGGFGAVYLYRNEVCVAADCLKRQHLPCFVVSFC